MKYKFYQAKFLAKIWILFIIQLISLRVLGQNENVLSFKSGTGTELDNTTANHHSALPFDDIGNAFTVDFWVKMTSTSTRYFFSKGFNTVAANTTISRLIFGINASDRLFLTLVDSTSGTIGLVNSNKTSNIRDDNWHHIAFVMDKANNQVAFFTDGDSSTVNPSFSINKSYGGVGWQAGEFLRLGFAGAGSAGEFSGSIDEFRIWNTNKSSDLLNATFRNNASDTALVMPTLCVYYRFNQGTGNGNNSAINQVIDISGNNIHGTMNRFDKTGDYSNFTVDTKSLPTLNSNTIVCSQTFTANWSTPAYNATTITGYMMDISTQSNFSSFVTQNISLGLVNTYKVSGLSNGTNYYYRIRTINSLINSNSNYISSSVVTPNPCTRTWSGTQSNNWSLSSNWLDGITPEQNDHVIIPATNNIPHVSGNLSIGNIQFTGTEPRMKLSNTLGDTITINGTITGSTSGTFEGNLNARMVLTNTTSGNTLRMYNPAGVSTENCLHQLSLATNGQSVTLGTSLKIQSSLQMNTSSTLVTGGNLTLLSNNTGTARIGNMGTNASISGNVKVSIYVPSGKRAFRFLGHPFNSTIGAGQLKSGIILTGNGGQTNGFDSSFLNNPSAFLYNNSTGNSSTSPDPGWEAITNGNAQTLNWPVGAGLRVLVRGDREQGVTGATPNASTITLEGTVNDGTNVTTLLSNPGSSAYNLVANPYCSNVDLNLCATSNVSSTVYIWDLSLGSKGAYQALSYVSSGNCIIAPYTSFFMVNTNSTKGTNNASITFSENAKVSQNNSGGRVLKGASQKIVLSLLGDSTLIWDRLELIMDPRFNAALEPEDGIKMINPEVSLYSILGGGEKLAIDYRKNEGQVIQLGIDGLVAGKYAFDFSKSSIPTGASYFLIDGDKRIKIETSLKYAFTLTTQELNEAKFRFKIEIESATNGNTDISKNLGLTLFPNPANKLLTIKIDEKIPGDLSAKLLQLDGQILMESYWLSSANSFEIPTHELPNGLYLLIVEGANGRKIEKILISHTD